MDLRHLRYFLCVAEELHFGRAARRLGISQPPLSQQIRALEEELGARLFDRTSRRVRLTEAGRAFEPEARSTLLQAERSIEVARLAQRGDIGTLRFAFIASGPFVPRVARALYRFRREHPDVELSLQELGRGEQVERARQRQIDIGLVRGFERPVLGEGLSAMCLLEEQMLVATRGDHPLATREALPTIADLEGEPLVLYAVGIGTGFNERFLGMCEDTGFVPHVAYEVGGLATLFGLVAAGLGITVISPTLSRLNVDGVVYRPFAEPVTTRLWLIHHEDLSPVAQAFKATLLAEEEEDE